MRPRSGSCAAKQRPGKSFEPRAWQQRDCLSGCIRRYVRDRLRLPLSNGGALRAEQIFNPLDDFFVFQQITTPDVCTPYLDGLNEAGIVFEHAFDSFFDELGRLPAGAPGKLLKA